MLSGQHTMRMKKGGRWATSLASHLLMSQDLAAGNLAGLEATGADVGLASVAVNDDGDALNVGTELTSHDTVGVADGTTGNGVLAAELTNLGHARPPQGRGAIAPAFT